MPTPTYQQFRAFARRQDWSVADVARHTQADDPLKAAEHILVYLAGTR